MEEIRILSTTAILGYGFPEESFNEGIKRKPHVIAVDAGSTDPGPYYLGAGTSFTAYEGVKRDMEYMIKAALELNVPVVVGSAGGCGADSHLQWNVDIVKDIAKENGYSFKMAVISSQIENKVVLEKFKQGKVTPLYGAPEATEEDINESVNIVAQMGHEPFVEALEAGAQVIISGRAYDPCPFAAIAIHKGYDLGLALHLGKILECAAIASTPGSGSDCLFGTLGSDYFKLETLNPARKCTTLSVAAHTLYEKSDPYNLPGPGGTLDLTNTEFIQETDTVVKVKGTKFVPTPGYQVKLEGAKLSGYRTVSVASASDPIFISKIDEIVAAVKDRVKQNFAHKITSDYYLNFRIYGKNGVMSMFEDLPHLTPNGEIGIVIEACAKTQAEADTICSFARSSLLHFGYDGRKSTAGNLAFPFSPSDFKAGAAYTFSLYHLMEVDSPTEYFPITYYNVEKGTVK